MKWMRTYRGPVMVALALAGPLAVAAALVPFRSDFASPAVALVLVVVITAVAIGGSRASGYLASASATLWFDYFHTRPYDSFDIHDRPKVEVTICLMIVGCVISELAARSRRHHRTSNEESRYVSMVRELANIAQTVNARQLVTYAETLMIDVLSLRACRFDPQPSSPPLARITDNGEVAHVGMSWPAESMGIPGPEAEILAQWRGRAFGRFVVTPTPGEPISQERRCVAGTLATLVAAGLAGESGGP
jgi:K+-sensing histidine kinase KdpD